MCPTLCDPIDGSPTFRGNRHLQHLAEEGAGDGGGVCSQLLRRAVGHDNEGVDENGKAVSLKDFAGKKLVLYFYPKDSTPGCTAEACDLRDNYQRFLALGYEVIGVSRDSAASHQRFIAKYELPFHLIADTDLTILKAYEAWGEKKMYGKVTEGTLRTTYVIDEQGVIIDAIGKVDTKNHTVQLLK